MASGTEHDDIDVATSEGIVYEYNCRVCKHEWRVRHHMDEKPLVSCPRCGSDNTFRPVSSRTKMVLEGGGVGWARDGYYAYNNRDSMKDLGWDTKPSTKSEFMKDLSKLK